MLKTELTDLFANTGTAHGREWDDQGKEDPDWPIWYAEKLRDPLSQLLSKSFKLSEVIYCLISVENERQAAGGEADWPPYYANHFLERFAPVMEKREDKMSLYYFPSCPFCRRVIATIEQLGLDHIELNNIHQNQVHFDALIAARGRGTVPVLRIESSSSDDRWMPESADISEFLIRTYG